MSNVEFGLTTWNEEAGNTQAPTVERARWDDLLKLKEGSNEMRIVTKPFKYWIHKYKPIKDGPGFPDKIKCSEPLHGSCAICDMVDENGKSKFPRVARYYAGVIDRSTQRYKVLDISISLYLKLKDFVNDPKWGDLSQYDVDVKVNPHVGSAGYYSVIPSPKEPLSKEDLAMKDGADIEDLKRKCSPPSPEWVAKRVATVNVRSGVPASGVPASGGNGGSSQVSVDIEETDGDDFEFPPA